jgi:hypothetical protein
LVAAAEALALLRSEALALPALNACAAPALVLRPGVEAVPALLVLRLGPASASALVLVSKASTGWEAWY